MSKFKLSARKYDHRTFRRRRVCRFIRRVIRGQCLYLIQSTFPNSDNLMELLLMIDAAKRASAYKIIAVIPYFGWARQDRKDKPRVSMVLS